MVCVNISPFSDVAGANSVHSHNASEFTVFLCYKRNLHDICLLKNFKGIIQTDVFPFFFLFQFALILA